MRPWFDIALYDAACCDQGLKDDFMENHGILLRTSLNPRKIATLTCVGGTRHGLQRSAKRNPDVHIPGILRRGGRRPGLSELPAQGGMLPGLGGRPDGHSVVRPASPHRSAGSPDGEEIQSHDGPEDLRRAHDKASEVRSGRQQAAKSRSPGSDLFALLLRNWQIPQVRSQVQARFRRNNPPAASCSVRIAKSEPCRRIYQAPGRNNPWEQIC